MRDRKVEFSGAWEQRPDPEGPWGRGDMSVCLALCSEEKEAWPPGESLVRPGGEVAWPRAVAPFRMVSALDTPAFGVTSRKCHLLKGWDVPQAGRELGSRKVTQPKESCAGKGQPVVLRHPRL